MSRTMLSVCKSTDHSKFRVIILYFHSSPFDSPQNKVILSCSTQSDMNLANYATLFGADLASRLATSVLGFHNCLQLRLVYIKPCIHFIMT